MDKSKLQLSTFGEESTRNDLFGAAMLSWIRDNMGRFPGLVAPSLNLFCGDQTSDLAPVGTFRRSTAGARLGQAGGIDVVAPGRIRRQWDASNTLEGWLIEEIRMNAVLHNRDLANEVWKKKKCTALRNQTGVDGAANAASLLTATATKGTCLQSIPVMKGTRFQTAYVKRVTGKGAVFLTMDGGDHWTNIASQLSLDTWTRVALPCQTLGELSVGFRIATQGDSIAVDGVQNEEGLYATSVLFTKSTAVIRAADVWKNTLSTSWFNALEGTMFFNGTTCAGNQTADKNQTLFTIINDTYSDRIQILRSMEKDLIVMAYSDCAAVAYYSIGNVSDAADFKLALSWGSSGFSASLNGAPCVASSGTTTLPIGLTTHYIGSDFAGFNQWGGSIRHTAYFPVALSDTDKIAITR